MADVLTAGAPAPGFSLNVTPDQKLALNELRGKAVILAFYPTDWSPVCGDQMALYNEVLPEFQKAGAELVGISVDGVWCHEAFAADRHLHFPLGADFEPKRAVARSYGVYREADGTCERALFVLDKNGVIAWSYCSPVAINPGTSGAGCAAPIEDKYRKQIMSELAVPITADNHKEGEAVAKCTLVEYGDYQCSYCRQTYPIIKQLQKHFGADLRFVLRNFSLREIHPYAEHAAETAKFAGTNGEFWQMHDLLHENQAALDDENLFVLASRLHLSKDELREALYDETYQPWVKADFLGGVHSSVNGAPTFFANGQRHDSGFDFDTLADAVRQQV